MRTRPGSLCVGALWIACACAEPDALDVAVSIAALRPDTPGTTLPPPVFSASDDVELLDSKGGSFRLHYTRLGEHAVPPADANADGIPDFVEQVADEYEAVAAFYATELGFERPLSDASVRDDNGGDARFDVYLLDFPTSADGSFRREACDPDAAHRCTGYMLHENDFAGRNYPSLARANRILASHEYFHAVQSAYNVQAGAVLSEGTAVWASEQYDPTLPDLEGFAAAYLDRTERSLTQEPASPADTFAYGTGVFFEFLSERYGRETIRELWAALRAEGAATESESWAPALDAILRDAHQSSLADAFAEFTRWNLYTASRADPSQAYARGEGYPEPNIERVTLPFEDTNVRVFPLAARFYAARMREAGSVHWGAKAAGELTGLRLLLAREVLGNIEEVRATEGDETSVTLAAQSGDTIHAVVLNTRTSGQSLRPDLCLGTTECSGAAEPSEDERDAGTSDAGEDDAAPSNDDSGCSAGGAGRDAGGSGLAALGGAGFWLLTRRRPRQAASRSRAPRSRTT